MVRFLNGTTYETTPELVGSSCEGCVVEDNTNLCHKLDPTGFGCSGVIWIEKETTVEELKEESSKIERTYTENQIRSVIDMIREIDGIDISGKFWDYFKVASDVEYNEYIRLKNKFNPQ